jgi:hypothetical protein
MNENFLFQLSKELEYSKSGEFVKTATIEFTPPNMSVLNETNAFSQLLMGSLMSAGKLAPDWIVNKSGEEKEAKEIKAPSGDEIRMMIFASQDIEVNLLCLAFKKIACKCGKLDEQTKIKNSHFDKMKMDDFLDMMCGYAANFTFPSLLKDGEG